MRFYLDNDVDHRCRQVLQPEHECWATSEAGRNDAPDDEQTVYAGDRGAVLITHDRSFTERRKRNTIGRHIPLVCDQPDGPAVLSRWLGEVVPILERHIDLVLELRPDGFDVTIRWE